MRLFYFFLINSRNTTIKDANELKMRNGRQSKLIVYSQLKLFTQKKL